jgi:CubicO group peptidase (beta-lactamase class C family)
MARSPVAAGVACLVLAAQAWAQLPVVTEYFPAPDRGGGWRTLDDPARVRQVAGVDPAKLDEAFAYIQRSSKNGGLLVVRRGWLVYEKYFGVAHREATPNTASCGKSFTSIAMGILMGERPELFPDGLDQKVYTPRYLPAEAFPVSDPRKAEIKLGQLLAMTAGIRGNNPGLVEGRQVTLDPAGPDGWPAMLDAMAAGKMEGELNTLTLWCEPGGGYSYATSSPQLVSMILRRLTGRELDDYVREKLAEPLGWGRWGWGYRNTGPRHTPGGGGIAPRPTDMLRFGYLLLHEGRWGGRQLVPADYVRQAARPSPYNPHSDYSLQFHTNGRGQVAGVPNDAFWKPGSGGHCFYVVPSLDLVAWKMGGRDEQYATTNTGVELPAGVSVPQHQSREGWKSSVGDEDPSVKTLQLIVEAVTVEAAGKR